MIEREGERGRERESEKRREEEGGRRESPPFLCCQGFN
jgi:hypothetical protein